MIIEAAVVDIPGVVPVVGPVVPVVVVLDLEVMKEKEEEENLEVIHAIDIAQGQGHMNEEENGHERGQGRGHVVAKDQEGGHTVLMTLDGKKEDTQNKNRDQAHLEHLQVAENQDPNHLQGWLPII